MGEKSSVAKAIDDYDSRHESDDKCSSDEAIDKELGKIDEKLQENRTNANKVLLRPYVPMYLLKDNAVRNALDKLSTAHDRFMKAKYDLYKERSEFYTNKENWDKCKEESGKATDSVFKEYARKNLANLMEDREVAEFEYEQCKRIFESL